MRCSLFVLSMWSALPVAASESPKILQRPAISARHIAFVYGGDVWVVDRDGRDARRLTTGNGLESHPVFSPDGATIAFGGDYNGNLDVYVVPTVGGQPTRLTYHPSPDLPVAWTPEGKSVLFRSSRTSYNQFTRLFTAALTGGLESEVPVAMGEEASYSPDGARLAYVPLTNTLMFPSNYIAWKRYRGGSTPFVWIADLATSAVEKLPRTDSSDFNPMWIGSKVYFLSDRDGATTLFAYDVATKKVERLLEPSGGDIKSASACADAIAFDRIDGLYLYDLKSQSAKKLDVTIRGDLFAVRPRNDKVGKSARNVRLSPTGARVVLEARGEILTIPVEKGDARNLTNTPGVADRDPAWSPDGKTIAYFSDESGEYELHLRSQSGLGEVKKFKLGDAPSFYYSPTWSPDGKRIAYADKRKILWYLDLDSGKSTKIDAEPISLGRRPNASWSPDGKWIVYTRHLKSRVPAAFLFSIETGKAHQITDGMSNVQMITFDNGGKYLYFTASTDASPLGFSSMSSFNRATTSSAYLVVLSKNDPSPLLPESDEEKDAEGKEEKKETDLKSAKRDAKEKTLAAKVRIDLQNLDQRIISLPVPSRNYVGLLAAKGGTVLLVEGEAVNAARPGAASGNAIHKFDLTKRKFEKVLDGVTAAVVSRDGEKLLYRLGVDKWFVTSTSMPKPNEGAIRIDSLEVKVDPPAEWRQIYRETWRLQRDFLYDPNAHGLNLAAAEKKYQKYLDGLGSRHDLSALMEEMLGELCLGHVFIFGGDMGEEPKESKTGLLGADYKVENGRYRFARVYRGENWNPDLRAPLLQPGAGVSDGEYLLAVNGKELKGEDNVYRFFEGTADKQTVIRVGPTADGKNSREVTVVPTPREGRLRNLAWVDDNRKKVDAMTGGKVAYVYVPDTSAEGFTRFNRYFFAQTDKQAVIIDDRFNAGGWFADHIVDYLRQPLRNYVSGRDGEGDAIPYPGTAIHGPKVMLVNERSWSGGDYLPYTFRQANLGRLVGKRTWGGLVGIGGYPTLIDGGEVTAPHLAIWFPNGRWEVENRGVAPDVEVEFDPRLVRQGKDPQLEKAVEIILEELKKHPVPKPQHPPYPNYYKPALKEPAEGK